MNKYRSHNCNELRSKDVGKNVILSGWVNKKRDHGNLLFLDLRDNFGITQCIIDKENSNFNPTNPYAATKACAELIINTYKYSYNLPIIITRCNNVYGINQHNEKVIPKFISNIIDNKSIEIHGTQNKKRDFIYIDDVISALEIIIINGVDSEIYNIGINNPIYIYDLANIICCKMNKKNHKIIRVKDRPFNDYRYNIDNTKLINIGWKPIYVNKNDFEKNLEKIINNIKNN